MASYTLVLLVFFGATFLVATTTTGTAATTNTMEASNPSSRNEVSKASNPPPPCENYGIPNFPFCNSINWPPPTPIYRSPPTVPVSQRKNQVDPGVVVYIVLSLLLLLAAFICAIVKRKSKEGTAVEINLPSLDGDVEGGDGGGCGGSCGGD